MNKVYLNRTFKASVEKVFNALTDPQLIMEWFGPKNTRTINAEVNLEVGGTYEFEVETKNDTRFFVQGKYLEIIEPHRLVYTTEYHDLPGADHMTSRVTLELNAVSEGTEMSFIQELDWEPEDISNRTESWELMFDRMEGVLN